MSKLKIFLMFIFCPLLGFAQVEPEVLSVWANEAIVATYTLDAPHYMKNQRRIAQYFTSTGWIEFVDMFNKSGIPQEIQKNNYVVSAVALMPPTITEHGQDVWVSDMPILVVYKNANTQVKQTLAIKIQMKAVTNLGVRGFAIEHFSATTTEEPCVCEQKEPSPQPSPPKQERE